MKKRVFSILIFFPTYIFSMQHEAKKKVVKKVMNIMSKAAYSDYIGEGVSQLEHGLQAAELARAAQKDIETIVAALLHDIGHQLPGEDMAGLGKKSHAERGALYLKLNGFNNKTVELVRGHVQAKRYLVYAEKYDKKLSTASKQTLRLQGGKMTKTEAEDFEVDPLFTDKIALRKWDEAAKDPNMRTAKLEAYESMIGECIKG